MDTTNSFVDTTIVFVCYLPVPVNSPPRPTGAELSLLNILWRRGPCTVRQMLADLPPGTGYTTALKQLQIMTDKGLVTRDDRERSHVYAPARPAETTRRQLLDDLLNRAFGGSAQQLVLQALAGRKPSRAELAELRRLIDALERKRP